MAEVGAVHDATPALRKVLVHQVRTLASLGKPGTGQPDWAALTARKRRKTLVVCHPCHETIHHGHHTANTA